MTFKIIAKQLNIHPSTLSVWLYGRDDKPMTLTVVNAKRLEALTGISWITWSEGYEKVNDQVVLLRTLVKGLK